MISADNAVGMQDHGPLVVSTDELRVAFGRLLDAVEVELGPLIELGADHYWLLETDDSFDLSHPPPIHAGQLSDDVQSLRDIEGHVVVWHDLDHLIGVLRRVSAMARP